MFLCKCGATLHVYVIRLYRRRFLPKYLMCIVTSFTEHKPGGMKMAELNPTDSKSTLMQASPNCLAITI